MPQRGRFPAVAVGLGIFMLAFVAQAQRVVLVRPPDADAVLLEAFNRLSAELRLQDFEVAILDTGPEPRSIEGLADAARRSDALASIAFVRRGEKTSVDVWFGDRVTGKPSVRTIEPPGGADAPNVLAIRAVDLLRTSLREFAGDRPPPPPDVVGPDTKPPPPTAPAPLPRLPSWQVRAEGMMLWNRPLAMSFGAALGVSRRLSERMELGILVAGPLVGNWEATEGSTSLRQEVGWAEFKITAWRSRAFEVGASLAGGVHHFQAQTDANPPYVSLGSQQVWSFVGAFGLHGDLRMAGNAALGLTVRAIPLIPGRE